MIVPVRCFSCGKPLGHLWETYQKLIKEGKDPKDVLDELGLKRYCCRGLFLGHVENIKSIAKYK